MSNYIIVLFKNKQKKKIIKSYSTESVAKKKFKSLTEGNKIIFPMKYENAEKVKYEIGLLTNQELYQIPLFQLDDIGRNEEIFVDSDDYTFLDVKPFELEEKIYDWQTDSRIGFEDVVKNYCNKRELKNIFTLNNKLIIQIDENFSLFSLKNPEDSHRMIDTFEKYFRDNSRTDAIFVKDTSTTQRKWLYEILESKGFDKQKLYRQNTTYSKRG